MKRTLQITILLAIYLCAGWLRAQTSSATLQLTVTKAPGPAAVSVVSSATTVPAGGVANFGVTVQPSAAGAPIPTGQVELLATLPGATAPVLVSTFPLVNGSMTCSYPLPATAPVGTYALIFAYSGDVNYTKSTSYQ